MMIWYAVVIVIALAVAGVTAIALATIGFLPVTDPQIAALAFIIFLVLELGMLLFIGHKRVEAASIQELFDCEVLQLEWNKMLVDKPDKHQISGAVYRFNQRFNQRLECEKEKKKAYADLNNWYSDSDLTPDTPLTQARLICQMTNLDWDEDEHHEWQIWLYVGLVAVLILGLLLGVFRQWSVTTYFTGPFLLLIPLAVSAFKATLNQNLTRKRLDKLKLRCDRLLEEAKSVTAIETTITLQTRQLQDEIYRHRITDTPVPDFIHEQVKKRRSRVLPNVPIEK